MKLFEIINRLEKDFPPQLAEEWDNVGLLEGDTEDEIHTVHVALDVTDESAAEAAEKKAELIITHHPLLFHPLKKVTEQDFIGKRLRYLIRNEINYYAMHTNFDLTKMGELNADDLHLCDPEVLEETVHCPDGRIFGYGRIGRLEKPLSLREFASVVNNAFFLKSSRVYGNPDQLITRAAVSSGAGKIAIPSAILKEADVLVTGDLDYHSAIDSAAQGLCTIDAGHYGTEFAFIAYMAGYLRNAFPELVVTEQEIRQPYEIID